MQRKAEEAVNNESRLAEFERKYNDPDYCAPVESREFYDQDNDPQYLDWLERESNAGK